MKNATTRKQRRERKWSYDVGSRPIWWLLEQFDQDRFVAINQELVWMILEAMSPAYLVAAQRAIARLLKQRMA